MFCDAPFAAELIVVPAGEFMMGSTEEEEGLWYKVPKLDEKGRIEHPVALEYQRYLSLTEGVAVPGATPMSHEYAIPETRLEDLAKELQTKLKMTSLRIVGDPELKVTRVGSAGHYIGQCMALLPRLDAIMVFECREWEGAEYVRDAIASGQKKALLQMPHEGGEEMGMDECAQWLQTFVSEVPVKFIPSGDPFWLVA